MPEGHVIHKLAGHLNERYRDGPLSITSPQGRFAASAELIDGHRLQLAEAVGKHLFLWFDEEVGAEHVLYIHLGLIGELRFEPVEDVWGQIRVRLVNDAETEAANLRGPQFCRLTDRAEYDAIRARSGEDPLRSDADPDALWPTVQKTRRSIGTLLMDQGLYAGVGNIYRAETLFRLGISPFLPGRELTRAQFDSIWVDLVGLMHIGVERGRIDTVRDEHLPEVMGREPRKDDHGGEVYVYRREGDPCYVCGTAIRHQVMQGRNLFWCPGCQPG